MYCDGTFGKLLFRVLVAFMFSSDIQLFSSDIPWASMI